jgi:hypothetical protein
VERVPFANSGPVRPSPPLYCHPEHCSTILDAMGAWDDKILPRPLLCVRWPSVGRTLELAYGRRPDEKLPHGHPRSRSWAGTGLATTYGRGEDRQLRGVVQHTAICSLELCGTIVNRLPLSPGRRGGQLVAYLHISAFTTILALGLNQTLETWRLSLLSRQACSPPLQALWCDAIERPERTPAGRTAHGRN